MKTFLLVLCTISLSLFFADQGLAAQKKVKPIGATNIEKTQIALMSNLGSSDPEKLSTDEDLIRGIEVFFRAYPKAKNYIEIITYDDHGDVEKAAEIGKTIVRHGHKIVTGLTKSKIAFAVLKEFEANNILTLTAFSTHEGLTQNRPMFFRACYSDLTQGKVIADYATDKLGARKIVILRNVDEPYSVGLAKVFQNSIKDKNSREIKVLDYTNTSLNFAKLAVETDNFKPDVVFIPDYATRAKQLIDIVAAKLPEQTFIGGDGWSNNLFMRNLVSNKVKLFYTAHWHSDMKSPGNKLFLETQRKAFPPKIAPSQSTAAMFDSLVILWTAIEKSQYYQNKDMEKLKKAIYQEKFSVTAGQLTYPDQNNNTPKVPIPLLRINPSDGKNELDQIFN